MIGEKFGRLKVKSLSKILSKRGRIQYNVICECGKKLQVTKYNLKSGNTKSCGCLRNELNVLRGQKYRKYNIDISKLKTLY
jgi:hypothetical protein